MNDGATDTDAIIQVRELHKSYRVGDMAVEVLKGIDLSIAAGEFLAVTGPSGSGKSTLLYMLGGMERPTTGSVTIKGQDVAAMDDRAASLLRRRAVGFVFQFYNLIPNLNVEENLLLPAPARRSGPHRAAARARRRARWDRSDPPASPYAARAVRRRAAACRHRPRADQPAGHHPGRRADRQPGQQHG